MIIDMRKVFNFSVFFYVVVGTFFYLPVALGLGIDYSRHTYFCQEMFFRYGAIFLFFVSMLMTPVRTFDAKILAFASIYLLLINVMQGFGLPKRETILDVFLALLFIKTTVENLDDVKGAAWALFYVVLINLFFCVLQYFKMDSLISAMDSKLIPIPEPTGLLRLPVHLGVIGAMISPILFIIHPLAFLTVIPLVYFSHSSTAVCVFGVSSVYLLSRRIPKKARYILPFIVICAIGTAAAAFFILKIDMPTGTFGQRFDVWQKSFFHVLKESPYFGFGLGSFADWKLTTLQNNGQPIEWPWAHNEYIQFLVETGILGCLILWGWMKGMFSKFLDVAGNYQSECIYTALFSIGLLSIIHFPFHLARTAIPALFIIALCYIEVKRA